MGSERRGYPFTVAARGRGRGSRSRFAVAVRGRGPVDNYVEVNGYRRGFTLIELIIALAILMIVLGMTYKILDNCLRTEAWIDQDARPEKIGQAIMSRIRKDLEGAVYRNLGTDRVFLVIDNGQNEFARDEIHWFTSQGPTPVEDEPGVATTPEDRVGLQSVITVSYFLKEGKDGLFTLFRRENIATTGDPFQGPGGINYEIYDKVKSFSVFCLDSAVEAEAAMIGASPWVESWDSQQRMALEAETTETAQAATAGGIPLVGDAAGRAPGSGTEGDPESLEAESDTLPPAAIPTVVRVEIEILAGDERGLFKNSDGTLKPPSRYSATVALPVAVRVGLRRSSGIEGANGEGEEPGIDRVGDTAKEKAGPTTQKGPNKKATAR